MFKHIVSEILLFSSRSVLWLSQWGCGNKRVKVSVKNQNNISKLLKLIEKLLNYKIRKFLMVLNFFYLF